MSPSARRESARGDRARRDSRRLALAVAAGATLTSLGVAGLPAAHWPAAAASATGPRASGTAVLATDAGAGARPTAAGLAAGLTEALQAPGLGSRVSLAVVDPASGAPLWQFDSAAPADTPASTAKVLTAAAVLDAYGSTFRLRTKVVRLPGAGVPQLVLVGAGDATLSSLSKPSSVDGGLAPASLSALADVVVRSLRKAGVNEIRLDIDDSLFSGPPVAPSWPASFVADGVIAPVSALSVDQGRRSPTSRARYADPALAAGEALAQLIEDRGISVDGDVRRASASPTAAATEVGAVASPTMAALVERMLTYSDNDLAEALAHLAGVKRGGAGSFAGGDAAVRATLTSWGIPATGLDLKDGSGLSGDNSVDAALLAATVAHVIADDATRRRSGALLTGLPVAGATGTLTTRFAGSRTSVARAVVRAKTGTLTGVSSLAGQVVTADGALLSFALMADRTGDVGAAQEAIDRVIARLAGCGCR